MEISKSRQYLKIYMIKINTINNNIYVSETPGTPYDCD